MSRPVLQLEPTERVLISVRPHFKCLFRPAVTVILLVAITIVVLWRWRTAPSWAGFAALGIYLLCALFIAFKIFQWRSKNMTVTTSRIIFSSGVMVKTIREIPNFKINSWYQHCNLWQRLLRAGTVILEVPEVQFFSASVHRVGKFKKKLISLSHPYYEVSNPERLTDAIRKAVLPFREKTEVISGSGQPADAIARQLSLLADLYRAGAITDEEYKEKSQEVLDNAQ